MDQENINNGRDQNIFNQPGTVNVDNSVNFPGFTSLPRLRKLEPNEYLVNYFLTLLSLIWYLATWLLLGLVAKSEFPINYVWKLVVACLKGSEEFSAVLNTEQHEIYELKGIALKARRNSKEENSRLNKLDFKIVVLENVIKRLYKEIETKEESVSRILNKLENQRKIVQIDLEPLRQRYDPNLYKLERIFQVLLEGKSVAERDYERIENILKELIERHEIESGSPSIDSVSYLIQDLSRLVRENPDRIRYSRLTTLKCTLDLLQWIFSLKNSSYSPEFTPLNPNEGDLSEFDLETLFNTEDNIFNEAPHHNTSSSSFSIDSLFGDESSNDSSIDLREIIDKPYGEFVNKSWLELVNSQIEKAVSETTETSQESIEKIKIGVEKEWIKRISIYGFDRQTKLAKVELALDIDWDNQEINFLQNDGSQAIDSDRVILKFQEFSREQGVITELRINYTHPENSDFYNRQLGFVRAESVEWATHGEVFKAPASGLSKFFIELNFGPSQHRSFGHPRSVDTSSSSGCFAALCIAGIVLFGLLSLNQQPRKIPPQISPNLVLTPQEQIYWEQLHKSISVWDFQTAQRNLTLLSQSQNSCISEFSTKLKANLDNKGSLGFKDINPIKRTSNEQYECNFVVTPYEFSP